MLGQIVVIAPAEPSVSLGGADPTSRCREILEAEGYQVKVLRGAREGLRVAADEPSDLLIVDSSISDMKPRELVNALRLDARTRDIPVLMLVPSTSAGEEGDLGPEELLLLGEAAPQEMLVRIDQQIRSGLLRRGARGQMVELGALRTAAELIGKGATTIEVAGALASKLVDHAGVLFVRFWAPVEGRRLELAIEEGDKVLPGPGLAEKSLASGAAQLEKSGDISVLSMPILAGGRPGAVLQVGWKGQPPADPPALARRLAPLLAASLAREGETEKWRKTARELELFYEMASATRYTLDLEHVARFVMDSLDKILDYDVAGLLLLDEPPELSIQTRCPVGEEFVVRVRTHILNTLRLTCGLEVTGKLVTRVNPLDEGERGSTEAPDKLRSFVNVPLTVGGNVAGLIHVSSRRENNFSQEEILFLNRVANSLASSIQGVRDILATVKGRIERMVDHMSDGVLMFDTRGEVVAMNQAAHWILKTDSSPGARVSTSELARALKFDPLALMRAERRSLRKVIWVEGVPYQTQLSPVEDSEGGLAGAVMAFRNFSEEKKIDEMKSEFINVVSHELRTPLTAIKNAVHLLLGARLGETNDKQKHFLNLAQRNIGQLIGMINDLLDLSKIEAGKMHIALRPLALAEPIEMVVSSLRAQAEEKGILLEAQTARDLPMVYGESALIERVLVNLVGNALKFTERGGSVRVEAQPACEESGSARRPAVQVRVSDTGSGIPPGQLESIFEKFHQLGRARGQEVPGTGLGLPITRELVEAHHGKIWAESEAGRGSRFTFVIPVLTEEELFFRNLERDLDRARRLPAPLTLAIARLPEREALVERVGAERYQALLDSLETSARKTIRRSTDRVELRREQAEVVAVLLDTPREGGRAFLGRLLEEIRSSAPQPGENLNFRYGCAVFPEEAATAEKLYWLARMQADEGQSRGTS